MAKLESLRTRLRNLEDQAHAGQTRSFDDHGCEVWIKGSGLSLLRATLKAQRDHADLCKDDLQLIGLWSRARPNESGLSQMIIATCKELVGREQCFDDPEAILS